MASNVISNFRQLGVKCKHNYYSIHFTGLVQRAIKTLHGKLKKVLTNPRQVSQKVGLLYVISWKLCRLWKLKPSLAHTDIPRMK